jgi:preprotein translocase subunit SecA
MFKFLADIFDLSKKEVKNLQPIIDRINNLEPEMEALKDKEFPAKTASFKERVTNGETLDDLLPEALAFVREVIRRKLGERAYDVQLMAAITLHKGRVAEQKTGEGKTLSAAIAAYLNALAGQGVHVITVNDYLARRDTGWYGQALASAGLKLACIIHEQAFILDPDYDQPNQEDERLRHLKLVSRKEAYQADITYGTNNEYGFDYLRDNMAPRVLDQVQRGHHFAIVDEVDSILIDEARTPLIISAPDTEPTEKYFQFAKLINSLSSDTDFTMDEKFKTASLTEHGIKKVEKLLGVDNLYEKDFDTIHHIENALRARTLFLLDRDYVVKDDQVIIVDEFTGRLMFGRRWSDGLHQAVEAKEGVKIQQESITLATISFQNYFRMYEKLAGMTGTAATEAEEFRKIYKLDVIVIPTNKQMARKDHQDVIYKTGRAKYAAVVGEIADLYKKGQPVLVGTPSIEKNEIIAKFLERKGIPHNVLNAKQHEKEAHIIADAGRKHGVTVATNMAGRGVDIILGGAPPEGPRNPKNKNWVKWQKDHDEVVNLGGLHIIGTERHESRRIDNQLRGRAGRQGDPGSSRFFLSLEDDVMRIFGGEQIAHLMEVLKIPEDQPIEHGMVSKVIESAQAKVEGFNFDMRKNVVEYDDVMNKQREIIYGKRQQILESTVEGGEELKNQIIKRADLETTDLVNMYSAEKLTGEGPETIETEYHQITTGFCEMIPLDDESQKRLTKEIENRKTTQERIDLLTDLVKRAYDKREEQIGTPISREIEKFVWLQSIDHLWIDHLDMMEDLREGVRLRAVANQDPLVEYKQEAYSSFERLISAIEGEVVRRIFRTQPAQPQVPEIPKKIITNIDLTDKTGLAPQKSQKIVGENGEVKKKLGRNDPCWCGSGKKWKKCHYPQTSA